MKSKRILICVAFIIGFAFNLFFSETTVRADSGTTYNGIDYSLVYDYNYYISRYDDVRRVFGGDPAKTFWHFINYGMREGRQASQNFNVNAYKNRYADLQRAYGNNLPMYYRHYCIWGKREGRIATELDYSKVFDARYYADRYADLKAAFGYDENKLLAHYLKYGINEGRAATSTFGINVYKSLNKDLQTAYGNNNAAYIEHFIKWGYKERRLSDADFYSRSVFNAKYYADKYPDLKAAFGYDKIRLFNHFLTYGMKEGRQASKSFNVSIYKKNYKDLRKAFGNDNQKYYIHYAKYGMKEKRNAATLLKNTEPRPSACTHNWVWKTHTETIHHDAVTHTKYYYSDAWDEDVYVSKVKCGVCGKIYENTEEYYAKDNCMGNFGHVSVYDHTIHHDPQVIDSEEIVDTPAYDEIITVKDYQYCSKCKKRK